MYKLYELGITQQNAYGENRLVRFLLPRYTESALYLLQEIRGEDRFRPDIRKDIPIYSFAIDRNPTLLTFFEIHFEQNLKNLECQK